MLIFYLESWKTNNDKFARARNRKAEGKTKILSIIKISNREEKRKN